MQSVVYQLPRALYSRVRPMFAALPFDEPYCDVVFEGTQDAPIFVDNPDAPTAAMLCHRYEFYIVGRVNSPLRRFIADAPTEPGAFALYYGFVPQNEGWQQAILQDRPNGLEVIGRRNYRWPVGKPAPDWRSRLPAHVRVVPIDVTLAERIDRDHHQHIAAYWGSYAAFEQHSFGYCATVGDEIASLAHGEAVSRRHANVSVYTEERFRRQGLAFAVCAAFVEHSLQLGIEPTWDTDVPNLPSAALAENLGFVESVPFVQISPPWGTKLPLSSGLWRRGDTTANGVTTWAREA